jgi:hypothetical protein
MLSFFIYFQLLAFVVLSVKGSVEPRILDAVVINTTLAGEAIEATEATDAIEAADAADDAEARRGRVWQPKVGAPFQIILSATIELENSPVVPQGVEIFDIDLFDTDKKTIDALKAMGKKVNSLPVLKATST